MGIYSPVYFTDSSSASSQSDRTSFLDKLVNELSEEDGMGNRRIEIHKPLFIPQVLCAIAVSFGATVVGGWLSFTSVAIPKMMNGTTPGDPIQIDLFLGSWVASLFFIGNIIGCLVGGIINQTLGARKAFLISSPLAAITWIMIALSHHIWVILVSRVFAGILFGVFQANGKVYNAEIAHPDFRGSIGTIISNMFALGSLYTYITGYFIFSWRTVAWLQIVPCFLFGVCAYFVPNSPYWLVERGREEEARASLRQLRGPKYDIHAELEEIVQKKRAKEAIGRSVLRTLCSKTFFMPFLRIGALMMITQWAGINVITSYMVSIFSQSGSSLDPRLAPILVCTVQQSLAMVSTGVLRVCPRKPLFLLCATMIGVSQCGMGTYTWLSPSQAPPDSSLPSNSTLGDTEVGREDVSQAYGWIPVAAIVSVNAFQTIGFISVVQLLLAESFPTEIRAYASGICGAFTAVNMFGSTKLFPWFVETLGFHGTFWMYGGIMFIEVIYAAISIPENRGQSLVRTEEKMTKVKGGKMEEMEAMTTV